MRSGAQVWSADTIRQGAIMAEIPVPSKNLTCVAFGGDSLDQSVRHLITSGNDGRGTECHAGVGQRISDDDDLHAGSATLRSTINSSQQQTEESENYDNEQTG